MLSSRFIRPAQMTEVDAVGDTQAFVSTPQRPRIPRTRSRGTQAFYLSPLAKITTPGQLRVETSVYAIRSRSRRRRTGPFYFIDPPLYLQPAAVPGTPGQVIVDVRYVSVAARTRSQMPLRAGHSRLHSPRVVRVKVWPPS